MAQPVPGVEPLLRRQPGARPGALKTEFVLAVHVRAATAGEGAAGPAQGRAAPRSWRGLSTTDSGAHQRPRGLRPGERVLVPDPDRSFARRCWRWSEAPRFPGPFLGRPAAAIPSSSNPRDPRLSHNPLYGSASPHRPGSCFLNYSFTNMTKDMSPRNRPNSNTDSGLTPTGRGPAGERPGSAPESNATGSPKGLEAGASGTLRPRNTRRGRGGGRGRVPRSGGRRRRARRAPRPLRPRAAAGGDIADELAAAEPVAGLETRGLHLARNRRGHHRPPTSRRTSSRPRRAGDVGSDSGSRSSPRRSGRGRSRRRWATWPSPAGEGFNGARQAPVAPRHPRRHPPARRARPATPHAARHRAALRRRQRCAPPPS